MPYKNIHWIKLEKRLLNDYRFYTMSENAQLTYVKLLMIAAETSNKPPKTPSILLSVMRSKMSEAELAGCIKEIRQNFPKFKEGKGFYYFYEWANRCNWINSKELPRNSQGTPKEGADKIDKKRIDRVINEYIKLREWETSVKDSPSVLNDIYKRNGKAAKNLLLLANNDEQVLKAMNTIADDYKPKNLTWTLETVAKHYPDLIKPRRRMPS